MSQVRVYLASITKDGAWGRGGIYFRELDEKPDHHAENGSVRRGPIVGVRTAFTAVAAGEVCQVEWLADGTSPLPNGDRVARLSHGDTFSRGEITYLVYVEPEARALGAEKTAVPYRAETLQTIDDLDAASLRAALSRFGELPYVAAAIAASLVAGTGFVQERGGLVPRARTLLLERRGRDLWLRIDVAVFCLSSGAWSEPTTTLERRLTSLDLEAIAECATSLPAIPSE